MPHLNPRAAHSFVHSAIASHRSSPQVNSDRRDLTASRISVRSASSFESPEVSRPSSGAAFSAHCRSVSSGDMAREAPIARAYATPSSPVAPSRLTESSSPSTLLSSPTTEPSAPLPKQLASPARADSPSSQDATLDEAAHALSDNISTTLSEASTMAAEVSAPASEYISSGVHAPVCSAQSDKSMALKVPLGVALRMPRADESPATVVHKGLTACLGPKTDAVLAGGTLASCALSTPSAAPPNEKKKREDEHALCSFLRMLELKSGPSPISKLPCAEPPPLFSSEHSSNGACSSPSSVISATLATSVASKSATEHAFTRSRFEARPERHAPSAGTAPAGNSGALRSHPSSSIGHATVASAVFAKTPYGSSMSMVPLDGLNSRSRMDLREKRYSSMGSTPTAVLPLLD
ncbi:MAG: hypothetical protein SGPRY_002105, partial [Prymnesium sp.]